MEEGRSSSGTLTEMRKNRLFCQIKELLGQRSVLVVLGAALFLRLLLWSFQSNAAGDDGERYYLEGLNWATYGVFSASPVLHGAPLPTAHDMPLFPGLIAVLLKIFSSKTIVVHLIGLLNILFFTGYVLNVMLCARLLFREQKPILIAGTISAVLPESVVYSLFYMPESLYLFLSSLATGLLILSVVEQRPIAMICAMVCQSLAVLTKPIGIPYMAFMVLIYFVFSAFTIKKRMMICCFSVGIALTCLMPWFIRNYRAFGHVGLTTISGTNLYCCNYQYMLEDMNPEKRTLIQKRNAESVAYADSCNLMLRSKILGKVAGMEISGNPVDYAHTLIFRHPHLYMGTGTVALLRYLGYFDAHDAPDTDRILKNFGAPLVVQLISWLILGMCYCLCGYGLINVFRSALHDILNRRWVTSSNFSVLFLCGSLVLFALVIGPVTATRYRVVMGLFISLLAACGGLRTSSDGALSRLTYPRTLLGR